MLTRFFCATILIFAIPCLVASSHSKHEPTVAATTIWFDGQQYNLILSEESVTRLDQPVSLKLYTASFDATHSSKPARAGENWLRLSIIDNMLYGLGNLDNYYISIEQQLQTSELPAEIIAKPYSLNASAGGGQRAAIEGDTIAIFDTDDIELRTFQNSLSAVISRNESIDGMPNIVNIEYIFDPATIQSRGFFQVSKILSATHLFAGFYDNQADLVINVAGVHLPGFDINPITNSGIAPTIIQNMTNLRMSGELQILPNSIAILITDREIRSSAGPHNGFASVSALCAPAGNAVISDINIGQPFTSLSQGFTVEILAHEVGHVLGGLHTACPGGNGIMAPFFDVIPRDTFSECSLQEFNSFINNFGGCVQDYSNVSSGFDGSWFDVTHDGEGIQIQLINSDTAVLAWYTYDRNGNQQWLSSVGSIRGNQIVFDQIAVPSGGLFGPDFNPDTVTRENWGHAIFSFNDCSSGTLTHFDEQAQESGVLSMSRLTTLADLPCPDNNSVANATNGFNITGTWFDPEHDGEGLIIEQLSSETLAFSWFSYDSTGNQAWFIGVGSLQSDGSYLASQTRITSGPIFGFEYNPDAVERRTWGEIRLTFTDCDTALLEYDSEISEFGSGIQNLVNLTRPSGVSCTVPGSQE